MLGIRVYKVTFCSCHSETKTFFKLGLFPATPKHPKMAFTFQFLDLLEAMVLECQVSLQDFVGAIYLFLERYNIEVRNNFEVYYIDYHQQNYKSIYPSIINCFEEYRCTKLVKL